MKPTTVYRNLNGAEHQRARQDMLRKIQRVYVLTEETLTPSPTFEAEFNRGCMKEARKHRWAEKLTEALGEGADNTRRYETTEMLLDCMREYGAAFYLRRTVYAAEAAKPKPGEPKGFYAAEGIRLRMAALYLNHVSNDIQAKLEQFTQGDRKAAFTLHKQVVGNVIAIVASMPDYGKAIFTGLQPMIDYNKTPEQNIDRIGQYWRQELERLSEHRDEYIEQEASHVRRLEAEQVPVLALPTLAFTGR